MLECSLGQCQMQGMSRDCRTPIGGIIAMFMHHPRGCNREVVQRAVTIVNSNSRHHQHLADRLPVSSAGCQDERSLEVHQRSRCCRYPASETASRPVRAARRALLLSALQQVAMGANHLHLLLQGQPSRKPKHQQQPPMRATAARTGTAESTQQCMMQFAHHARGLRTGLMCMATPSG
jgi:hypothetical protein